MPILRTITLGCKVNQYETEYVREGLVRLGYRDAREGEAADLCVVNTCTVTVEGEAKSRKLIRQLARQNPRAEIVVMGCYATRAAEEVARLPGVAEVITDKRRLPEWLAGRGLIVVPTGISAFGTRHRAYVKVQDGCQMGCSYCIIPSVRPVLWSRPVEEVLAEVGRLVENGHREIVLTGIHLGHYGLEARGGGSDEDSATESGPASDRLEVCRTGLACLVERIAAMEGEFRVRLSSLEAAEVTPELLAVMRDNPDRVCPHLHISMQSGSDAVLRRMRRRWPASRFIQRCREVREALDQPALTTDVIVGFPGETDEDFAATCRAVEEAGFSKLHIFRFSPRQGTAAADMPDRVPGQIQQERATELARIGDRLRQSYFESLSGRPLQVLVETPSENGPDMLSGTSDRYAPVEVAGDREMIGRFARVIAGPVVEGRIRAASLLK
jgi:threonylcarbamoyladenosine tRNA methylthiotransferase MtaB